LAKGEGALVYATTTGQLKQGGGRGVTRLLMGVYNIESSMGLAGKATGQAVWQSVTLYQAVFVTRDIVYAQKAVISR
jgi:hypothetical protein